MKAVNIRVEEELYEYLQKRAEKEHRSLSNMIISILLTEKETERKTAIWIPTNETFEYYDEMFTCSNCHYSDFKSDYCPNCGAKMILPNEDEEKSNEV